MQEMIEAIITQATEVNARLRDQAFLIEKAVRVIVKAFQTGKKVVLFGNGGSASDCEHIAAEFLGRFRKNRLALPAVALTTNSSVVTAIANDFGYDQIFAKQAEGIVQKGDIVIAISTSGSSKNVIKGIKEAKKKGAYSICFTGSNPGLMQTVGDILFQVASCDTPRIQEGHIVLAHIICELVEREVFNDKGQNCFSTHTLENATCSEEKV